MQLGAFSVAAKDAKQLSLPAGFRSSGIPESCLLHPLKVEFNNNLESLWRG